MSTRTVRVLLSVLVIGGSLTALLAMSVRESAAFYKHVDEVMVSPDQWYGKPLKLHGFVADLKKRTDSLHYKFEVTTREFSVPATYTGIVPDTFKDGSEVVLTGRLSADGFHADEVMAKCPSKYEPGQAGR
ncbi:MAG TPA: cytochrome c maturation protein CcmE [Vicinamibacterales bacterium]|nr:cytochrome c maturation protein CcmE [Vicinamibacterales bacterium]